jgi:hypothetical protein
MVQEGVTFTLGLLTPGGDAQWIATIGVPQSVILVVGILLLVAGIGTITTLLPLVGIEKDDPQRRKLLIVLVGMCSLMLIRFLYSSLTSPEATMENFIPLVLSTLLAAIVVLLHKPITQLVSKTTLKEPYLLTWPAYALALLLGISMLLFQFFVFN